MTPNILRSTRKLASRLLKCGNAEGAIEAWKELIQADPGDLESRINLVRTLADLGRRQDAKPHLDILFSATTNDIEHDRRMAVMLHRIGQEEDAVPYVRRVAEMEAGRTPGAIVTHRGERILFEQDGRVGNANYAFYRGERPGIAPNDRSFTRQNILTEYFAKGLMPERPFVDETTRIAAFGSCFAEHISAYLDSLGYHLATRRKTASYLARMGEGIVNSYAIRQQFEWAWERKQPEVALWRGYDGAMLGYDEEARLATRLIFDAADLFIITLGLSEVWYDEPTGEVFWSTVPAEHFDPTRHKFRVATFTENLENLRAIHALVQQYRPEAALVFTLSPIPLAATFRPIACTAADSASKAILRAALDEFGRTTPATERGPYYFPSYEIALRAFDYPYLDDRRHLRPEVLDLNMAVFERYYCKTGLTDEDLVARLGEARRQVAARRAAPDNKEA